MFELLGIIIKGGPALKAVSQSRFEPAQKEGKNVPAEYTYIYRFRLKNSTSFIGESLELEEP
jgi:hypothetical protein